MNKRGKKMNKVIGYVAAGLGILSLALSYDAVRKLAGVTIPSSLTSNILLITGLILVIISIIFLKGSSDGKQPAEVPIYKGKNVVGFRRLDK